MMRRNSRLVAGIVAVLVLAVIAGCGGSAEYQPDEAAMGSNGGWDRGVASEPAMEMEEVAMEKAAMDPDDEGVAYAAERLIIRSGNISMYVEDTLAAQATIEQMVESMAADGAFVVSANEYGGTEERQPQISMAIRIPAARFDETMERLADLAVIVNSSNESAEDVTEEYVDLEARLESLEAARQRLLEIMEEARNTEDLLEAEQQLTEREAQIESIKGRMQYLEDSARLSSISIELQADILSQPVSDQWRPAGTARRAVETLLDGLQGFGDFVIFFSIAVLPWLVAAGLVILMVVSLIRWRARRSRAGQATTSGSPEA